MPDSRVTVHAAEEEVDTEVGDQHTQEGNDAIAMEKQRFTQQGQ